MHHTWLVRPFVAYRSLYGDRVEIREDFDSQDAAIVRYRELVRFHGTRHVHLCMGTAKVQRS